jgi:hypothetical protein
VRRRGCGGGDYDSGGWSNLDKDAGGAGDDLDARSDKDNDSDDDDSDDDEAALQAELAKIKAEREAIKRIKQAEEDDMEESKFALPVSAREKQNRTLFVLL